MAFSNEGFSIREYTGRMRSENVVKCWPFDDVGTYDNDQRKMKSFLPQITVKKFRWWFDELQLAISPSNTKKVKREKCFNRNDDTSQEAEESDDDGRLAFKKPKTLKRRSIVELCAVAPPVENKTLHDEEEEEEEVEAEAEFDGDDIEMCGNNNDGGIKNANLDRKDENIRRGHQESGILLKKKFNKDGELKEFRIAKKDDPLSREKGALPTNEHQLYNCGAGPAVFLPDCGQRGNAQLPEKASFISKTCQDFDAFLENNIPNVNELSLKEFAKAQLHSAWSAIHPNFVPEGITSNFRTNSIPGYPIPRLTPKELMPTICYPFNWKQKEIVHGKTRMQDNFIGLPLNSHGELIKMNPWFNTVVAQSKISRSIPGNFTSLGAKTDVSSGRTPKHLNNFHIQKNITPCQVQSIMRLMGKEFTVGKNNLQQLEQ